MSLRLLTSIDELEPLAGDWERLAGGVPMRGPDWLIGWARHYEADPFVLSVWRGDQLIGLAPWRTDASVRSGRVLCWLGDGEVCTDHLTLICAESDAAEVVAQIADWLVDESQEWDLLSLDHCDQTDTTLGLLFDALAHRQCETTAQPDDACWTIELPPDWEAYLALQSKSHRKQLRRAERRVLNSDACVWRLVETPDELHQAWPILVDLHQRRRNSLGEPGCFASPPFAAFQRELAERLLAKDQLRVSWLELDGRPAAAELHFACPNHIYAYQGGVDPDRLDDEPGRLSTIATLHHAMQQSRTSFDFLRGDEPYKAHWRASPQPTLCRCAAAPRRAARLRAQANRAADSLHDLLKSGLQGVLSHPQT
ncbi:hypothetical protein Pla123a_27000 [Posidoniimonas polymericola]|uniref:BioF2-like acetyltransferase domain-containing protein n=1 Tax=Posidoniimonas polymericola TaxID=2528002 RepID=A0A5C5YM36_9BACT|nr:GNAT family N-acetyltransferase [Posidoniimonas polymericola]TWT75916.1 hypothetical protein Pla123a_27000 [Posidoniimonas polymericola]